MVDELSLERAQILRVPEGEVRFATGDTGGSAGMKSPRPSPI